MNHLIGDSVFFQLSRCSLTLVLDRTIECVELTKQKRISGVGLHFLRGKCTVNVKRLILYSQIFDIFHHSFIGFYCYSVFKIVDYNHFPSSTVFSQIFTYHNHTLHLNHYHCPLALSNSPKSFQFRAVIRPVHPHHYHFLFLVSASQEWRVSFLFLFSSFQVSSVSLFLFRFDDRTPHQLKKKQLKSLVMRLTKLLSKRNYQQNNVTKV